MSEGGALASGLWLGFGSGLGFGLGFGGGVDRALIQTDIKKEELNVGIGPIQNLPSLPSG